MALTAVKVKVVYLIDKMGAGGSQTHLCALASGLDPSRYVPSVVCLIRGGVSAERLRGRGVHVRVLGLKRLYGPRALGSFLQLTAWLRRSRPAIVHTYLSAANVFGAAAARAAELPGLITSRRDNGFADGKLLQRALALTNRWASRVVAVSEDAARVAAGRKGLDPDVLTVIPNGIDLERFSPRGKRDAARRALGVDSSVPLVVCVGHLTRVKAVDVLVDAAVAVRRRLPQAVFLVAGRGPERETIVERARSLGVERAFRLLGSVDNVPDLLEAADLFVLPSRAEGQPNALLEAMAMGTPVVATRVGGVPELARHGREALLVPPDAAEDLARSCVEILRSPELALRLARAGRQRVRRHFHLKTMIERYEALYERVAVEGEERSA